MTENIEFTRIDNDTNGNPRYVCHFVNLLTKAEKNDYEGLNFVSRQYAMAVKRANSIGGRKYHTKRYGGGIVFQSYSILDTERSILEAVARDEVV